MHTIYKNVLFLDNGKIYELYRDYSKPGIVSKEFVYFEIIIYVIDVFCHICQFVFYGQKHLYVYFVGEL